MPRKKMNMSHAVQFASAQLSISFASAFSALLRFSPKIASRSATISAVGPKSAQSTSSFLRIFP
jgi:hypothetical protein